MRDSHTISRFRGLNQYDSVANVKPGAALFVRNVLADPGGALQVARETVIAVDFGSDANAAFNKSRILSLGLLDTFQVTGDAPRLIIQQGPVLLFCDAPTYLNLTQFGGVDFGLALSRLDYTQSNSVIYFSSGTAGGKVLPGDPTVYNWGIAPPTVAPDLIASTTFLGVTSIQRAGGIVTVAFTLPHNSFVGSPIYVDSDAPWGPTFAGTFAAATRVDANTLTYVQAGPDDGPYTRATYAEGLTAATGYQYLGCFGFSKTGHWSTASLISLAPVIGPLTSQSPVLISPIPTDPQVDQFALFRNLDDGGDWYLVDTYPLPTAGPFPMQVAMLDTTTDDVLSTSAQTPPYDNGVSPNGKYLCAHLDRILMAGIEGDEASVAYTGYDSINFGRPQESWCQFNRIAVGQGQSTPNSIGSTRYGAVLFCTNKSMFMVRGTLNDITTSAVTPLSFTVTELPFKVGNYSHYATQSTPGGVIFLSDSLELNVFDGYYPPSPIAPQLNSTFQRITPGLADAVTSEYLSMGDREWYIISIPVDGSITPNLTIILDITQDPDHNAGSWLFEQSIDAIINVLNPDGTRDLMCAQNQLNTSDASPTAGYLTRLPYQYANSDVNLMANATYRMGYFGIKDEDGVDEWSYFKLFRYLRLATSLPGVTVIAYLVDGQEYTFDNPYVQRFDFDSNYGSLNVKARAVSLELQFPSDVASPLLALTLAWNFCGKR